MAITRRTALALTGGAALAGGLSIAGGTGMASQQTPESAGFAADIDERLTLGVRSGLLSNLHAVLALRNGDIVLERYFSGQDEDWGRPLGSVDFDAATLHDLRSVTKSITSLVYGIALDQGRVAAPGDRLLDSFPQYPDLAEDPQRSAWTVSDALNMTLGTEWNEQLPYTDPRNSEIAMEQADDRYRFILDRPIVSEPGTQWSYNGGCSALLGYLVERGTGQRLDDFANEALFAPLGIETFDWNRGNDGVVATASGLRLNARDLARIGEMMRADGRHDGRQVVSSQWLKRCRTPQVQASYGNKYSNQWYLSGQPVPAANGFREAIFAMGNGGQRLFVMPSLNLTVVTYSGNYNRMDQWINPTLILQKIVLANITEI